MLEQYHSVEQYDDQDKGILRMLHGVGEIITGIEAQYAQCAEEKQQYKIQLASAHEEPENIVSDGKQNELLAILNAIYAAGMIKGSKKDFMQRMAKALGCSKLSDYNAQLHKIKLTYKYEDIFTNLCEIAQQEKVKDN